MLDPLVIAFGLGVGILVGLTGIGGGSLMTPLLILVAGVNPHVAIGTDLAYGAITKTVGGWRHLRKGTVDLGVSKWLAFGSVPGSLLGVWLLEHVLSDQVDLLLGLVAVALVVAALTTLGRSALARHSGETESVVLGRRGKLVAMGAGALLGAMLGLTSVGSGALIGPVLILVFHLSPRRVVGTDVFHAAILLWSAGLAHWVGGNVDLVLMGSILLGSLPGVVVGTALIDRVPVAVLRPLLGCVLLGSALGVSTKAGLALPVWTIVAVPAAVGTMLAVVHRRRTPRTFPAAPAVSQVHQENAAGI